MDTILETLEALYRASAGRRRLADGAMLFATGDPVKDFHVIERGRMRLVRYAADGTALTLYTARDGETFAEASLFSDRYHCDAVAAGLTVVRTFSKPKLRAALRRDGDAALLLTAHLARQVQSLRSHIELMTVKSARDRVFAYLQNRLSDNGRTLIIDRTWKAVASEIGLTHEAVYRALAQLERERVIRRQDRMVELLAWDGPPV